VVVLPVDNKTSGGTHGRTESDIKLQQKQQAGRAAEKRQFRPAVVKAFVPTRIYSGRRSSHPPLHSPRPTALAQEKGAEIRACEVEGHAQSIV